MDSKGGDGNFGWGSGLFLGRLGLGRGRRRFGSRTDRSSRGRGVGGWFGLGNGWGGEPGLLQRLRKEVRAGLNFPTLLLYYHLLYHLFSDRLQPLLDRGRLLGAWHGFVEKRGGRGRQPVDASSFLTGRQGPTWAPPSGPGVVAEGTVQQRTAIEGQWGWGWNWERTGRCGKQ